MLEACPQLYAYQPSAPLAAVGIGIYAILTFVHLGRMLRSHTWDNTPFVLGGAAELMGFCFRLYSSLYPCSTRAIEAYNAQSVLLTLGPTLPMITVALTQPCFFKALGADRFLWLPLRFHRSIYLGFNTALLALQVIGMSITAAQSDTISLATGIKIVIASYVAQTLIWAALLAENTSCALRFRAWLGKQSDYHVPARLRKWKWLNQLFGLAVSIVGLGRNLVRLTTLGGVQFLVVNEWPQYAFDGYQLAVVMAAWGWFYLPGRLNGQLDAVNDEEDAVRLSETNIQRTWKGNGRA